MGRGCGGLVLGFSLPMLVLPQACLSRASGAEASEMHRIAVKRKQVEANGHDAEEGEAVLCLPADRCS
jgi:hypothetical protein